MNNLRSLPRKIQVFDNIEEIIRQEIALTKHEEPFFIVNVQAILKQHKNWIQAMPRIKPYYAVKCNPSPIMIEVLAGLGVNFDCASKGEIDNVMALNVTPDRIIYANPCKTKSYIKHAKSKDVNLMTFDSEMELKKIADLYPECRLILRIKVDDSHSVCKFSAKFGASLEDAEKLLHLAKKLKLNIVGVSFHVGSGCESALSFEKAIEDAKVVFDQGLKLGFKMRILDIGGGFPGNSNPVITFEDIANVVSHTLDREFPINYVENFEVIAEPGRYYAASVFTLATQIIAKKTYTYNDEEIQINSESIETDGLLKFKPNLVDEEQTINEQKLKNVDQKRGIMYYLNDGVYGSFNCTIFDYMKVNPQPYYLNNDENNVKMSKLNYLKTTLWGPTCDSLDMIRKNIYLPEMEIGDWIIFREMGAYTICAASNFNGFKLPIIKYYLDNYTINTLRTFLCWPRIKNVIMKIEEKERDDIDLFDNKILPTYNELNKFQQIMPKIHRSNSKDMGLIPVH